MAGADFIAYHAVVRPGRLACLDLRSGEALDYRALDARVARAAGQLTRMLDGAPGERVATLTRNRLEAVVLHYACARAGAIFAPLNWRLAGPELAALVSDAAPRLLFYEAEFEALAQAAAGGTVAIVPIDANLTARIAAAEPPAGDLGAADAPWTLLYTSGATGRPKGVVITRDNARSGAANLAMIADIGPGSVMLCDPPLFHTVGLFAIAATALQMGGTLVLSDRFHAATTLQRLSDPALGVTHYFGVPQIGQMLVAEPGFEAADLSRLRAVLMGGSPLPAAVTERFAQRGVVVSNGFGMTETCTVMHMPLDIETARRRPGCVGAPTPFVAARIVGPDGADMQAGEVGELWLKGPGITPGYWRQPQATAEAFHDGWLRTGDAAVRDADGLYRLVDRWKDMYISGGENVYPAEVEAVIALVPGVAEAAVVGVPSPRWGETGCAFVVAAPGADLGEAAIHEICGQRLAGYKRPGVVRFVDALPRTASGKVLKGELRRIHAATPQALLRPQ